MNNTNDLLRRMIAAVDNVMRNWSRRDTSGNVYHCAVITSTLTGNSFYLKDASGSTGAEWVLSDLLKVSWSEMYTPHIENMPKREWKNCTANKLGKYPHEVTADMLRALEVA